MSNTFYTAFLSEKYKLLRNRQIFGVLLLPALLILLIDGYIIYDIMKTGSAAAVPNPWKVPLDAMFFSFFTCFTPLLSLSMYMHAVKWSIKTTTIKSCLPCHCRD